MKIFETGCGMKRDRDKLHFEGGIRDKTLTCGIVSESRNLKIHEGTTLLLFSQALVFVFKRFSALQSEVNILKYERALKEFGPCGIGMEMLVRVHGI